MIFQFLLIGGRTPDEDYSSLVWSLSLGLGAEPSNPPPWTPLPHLLEGRHSHSCFHHDGKVRNLLKHFYKRGRHMQKIHIPN